jgi:hypothetical protein
MNTIIDTNDSAKRYRTRELVHVDVCGRMDKIFCKLENLSKTGASLKILSAKITPRAQDVIKITVNLNTIKKVHILYAEIVWVNGLDLGVAFIEQTDAHRKIINNGSRY